MDDASDRDHLQACSEDGHPDGRPHKKACAVCAFRRSNPQKLTEEDFDWLYLEQALIGGFTFYCTHRRVDGYHRECACWAAIEAGKTRMPRPALAPDPAAP